MLDVPDLEAVVTGRGETYGWALTDRRTGEIPPLPDIDRAGPLLALTGLHRADGDPFAVEQRWIDLATVPDAAEQDFAAIAPGSWLLAHVPWSDARHRIGATGADARQAAALDIAPGEPCLRLERWTWRTNALVTYVRQVFPAARYDLVAEFKPTS
jgi:GntR family histidine utilization transcriptional repressor